MWFWSHNEAEERPKKKAYATDQKNEWKPLFALESDEIIKKYTIPKGMNKCGKLDLEKFL